MVDYRGLKVGTLTELRKRLNKAGAEVHVVKNSIFRIAAKEAGVGDLNGTLAGQLAVVTGQRDISAAAKVVKTFGAEFDRLKVKFGYLNNQRLETAGHHDAGGSAVARSAARQDCSALFNAPATKLVRLLNTPASQLARVLQAKAEKGAKPKRGTRPATARACRERFQFPLVSRCGTGSNNKQQRKSSVCRL